MNSNTVIVERIFDAPLNLVWRALTEQDLMKLWYFDLSEFKLEKGFVFKFTGCSAAGTHYQHICEITEIIPLKKLSYSWRYDGYEGISLVTFELFDEAEKTKLILTHSGLDTFPSDIPDLAIHKFEEGWIQIINNSLQLFIETHTK